MPVDPLVGAAPAEGWALALGSFGRGCVWAALLFNIAAIVLWLYSTRQPRLQAWAKTAFSLGCLAFVGAFVSVASLFVTDQYQFKYVFDHGAKDNELRYKIAGTWSGQEGSILLWATTSAIFGLISARATVDLRRWYSIVYAAFLTLTAAILAFESPFVLRPLIDGKIMVPSTGQGLNPSLMNYWVVIHPPTIFAGFGSLTVLFSWSFAALVSKDLSSWIPRVRPWALVSLSILGVGLAMGGFWAYETLGWGGFWMWDPVENTSFVPWVAVAAFLHGLFVQVSRKKWQLTNALLAGVPFLLFCYGTFLTRSGYLGDTSVHSFAEMNRSALKFLIALILLSGIAFLGLWVQRAKTMRDSFPASRDLAPAPINREKLLGIGVWVLIGFGVVTAIGMSVPFLQNISGHKPKVVEEPLYNTVLSFLFLPMTLVMGVAPFVTWRGLGFRTLMSRFVNVFAIAIGLVGVTLLWVKSDWHGLPADLTSTAKLLLKFPVNKVGWMMVLTFFSLFGIVATLWKLIESLRKSPSGVGGMLAHLGVGVALFGLIFSRGMEQKQDAFVITSIRPIEVMGHKFLAKGITSNFVDPNNKVEVDVAGPSSSFVVRPGLYFNGIDKDGQPTPFIWPAIHGAGLYDLYLVVHNFTFEASGPTEMKAGDQRLLKDENILVQFNGLRTEGPLGQPGAKFFAKVNVRTPDGSWDVEPSIQVGEGGMESKPADVDKKWKIDLVRIDAATKAATLQVKYAQPAYVAELFYKPLTILVWLGIGIMTVGGGLTAWTRRFKQSKPIALDDEQTQTPESQE